MSALEPAAPNTGAAAIESVALFVAGVAVLATARLGWVAEGPGSRLNGQELAETLRNGALVPDGGEWVAAAMYLLIALGGVLIASGGFAGQLVASMRLVTSAVVVAPFAVAALTGWFPLDRWSSGPVVIVIAGLVAAAVSVRQLRRHQQMVSGPPRR